MDELLNCFHLNTTVKVEPSSIMREGKNGLIINIYRKDNANVSGIISTSPAENGIEVCSLLCRKGCFINERTRKLCQKNFGISRHSSL